jgi:UDP-N-acetylmuramyl pentapeptide phosphotransferase/UDP-N-acetylglucosamine-1-phosphate transferase
MPGTGAYLLIGAIAAVVTFVTTPVVVKVARRVGWVVQPDPRRIQGRHPRCRRHAMLSAKSSPSAWPG